MKLHINFTDLHLFINIAEANSLTRGAERTCISAPAASVRVRQLEESIGTKLLERNSQGVTLTPPGQALLHHARLVIEQIERLGSDLGDYVDGMKGHVRLVVAPPALVETLPDLIKIYLEQRPKVSVDVNEVVSSEAVRMVADGRADIGLVGGPLRIEGLDVRPYVNDRLALLVSLDHPLAALQHASFAQALSYDIIGITEQTSIYRFMRRIAEENHTTLKVRLRVNGYEMLSRMVEADLGIGVVSQRAASLHLPGKRLKMIELSDPSAAREILLCARDFSQLTPYTKTMVDLLLSSRSKAEVQTERLLVAD